MTEIARNNGRFYYFSRMQFRLFPMKRAEAEMLLATGQAYEIPYLPLSRPDIIQAHDAARKAIAAAAA